MSLAGDTLTVGEDLRRVLANGRHPEPPGGVPVCSHPTATSSHKQATLAPGLNGQRTVLIPSR